MAEIRVERKRRSLVPYLLVVLALVLVAWWFLGRDTAGSDEATPAPATTGAATGAATGADPAPAGAGVASAAPAATTTDSAAGTVAGGTAAAGAVGGPALADYVAFVGNSRVERNEDEQHAYTAGGLRRLAAVLEGLNPAGPGRAQVDLMRQKADSLEITSSGDDRHADMTRAAFTAAAEAMRALPGASGASEPLAAVTRAAGAVRPERHMLEQKDQIQAFFDAARDALRAVGGTGAA